MLPPATVEVLVIHCDICTCTVQLGMLRVEAEKAEEEGRDESWQAVGEHALVSLAIVRAYRERALHAAYSGTLPQLSPRRLPGMFLALAKRHARSSPLVAMARSQGCAAVPGMA